MQAHSWSNDTRRLVTNAEDLYEDHRKLDVLFEDLLARAEVNQWWLCDEIWDELTTKLEAHMAFEEHDILPALLSERPQDRPLVERLLQEHEQIRATAFRIGVALQLHQFDAANVRDLIARLRAHAEEENRAVYPKPARGPDSRRTNARVHGSAS